MRAHLAPEIGAQFHLVHWSWQCRDDRHGQAGHSVSFISRL